VYANGEQSRTIHVEQMTAPMPMKLITMHVYILFEGVNSHSLPLSGEAILSLKSNGLGKSGCFL